MFGPGIVAAVTGSGADARITVDFSSSVGRKKLLAGVAKLERVSADAPASISSETAGWCEALDAEVRPRPGRRIDAGRLSENIRAEVRKPEFWIAVRERLRSRGHMPRVIDDPSGRVSISTRGALVLGIRVEHNSINDARMDAASNAIFDELSGRFLRDFDGVSVQHKAGLQFPLIEDDLVFIEEEELGELPARDMRQRPKRVQPKGVIRSLPKRRDDY